MQLYSLINLIDIVSEICSTIMIELVIGKKISFAKCQLTHEKVFHSQNIQYYSYTVLSKTVNK